LGIIFLGNNKVFIPIAIEDYGLSSKCLKRGESEDEVKDSYAKDNNEWKGKRGKSIKIKGVCFMSTC